ncbi:MAG: DegT/DnrJ/EryC1/StrS family aminotransferase [Desulfobacterales bacterium]|nr:DegT/DnrJ/EryC1/StrS family aminotransferase [Desulfobacterales bacterium]
MIPLFYPPKQNVDRMIGEIRDTLSGRWWGQGPKVDLFEKKFGEKFGFKYCVMTNSGTAALHLAYILAGIKKDTRVIVPVLTCTATCHPLKMMGADIDFVDIRGDTLTLDPSNLRFQNNGMEKAIVVVHFGGLVTDTCKIRRVATGWGVKIIEDACQALGAKGVGYGDYTCFSFQAIKSLSTGDGGMLVVKTEVDYLRAKRLRWFSIDREQKAKKNWQAWDRRRITFEQEEIGYKYQPTDIDASIGLVALEDFDQNVKHRHCLVNLYRKELEPCKKIELLKKGDSADWLFMVKVKKDRDAFAKKLLKAGIETNVAHIRNDLFGVFGGHRLPLPNMDAIEDQYLCLPLNSQVSEKDVKYICQVIRTWK